MAFSKIFPLVSVSFLLAGISAPQVSAQGNTALSCKTHLYKVADSYQLPYKNDGTEMAYGTNIDRVGRYVYTFDVIGSQPGTLTKLTVQHVHQGKEPLTIREVSPSQYSCNQGPEKTVTCSLNYSYQDTAYAPVYVMIDLDASNFTDVNTSTMFALETSAGPVSCASYYRFKGEPQKPAETSIPISTPFPTTVATSRPTSRPTPMSTVSPTTIPTAIPVPTTNPEVETLKQDVDQLKAELNETRQQQSSLWTVVNSIQSFLQRMFGGVFNR